MSHPFGRREALALLVAISACGRRAIRCAFCGMPIDPDSPWNAELVLTDGKKLPFDSPRCALLAWRSTPMNVEILRVQDYYERRWREGGDVLFVVSSDVLGPMGPDLVPVDRPRAEQFAREHTGTRPLQLTEVTLELLKEIH